MNSHKHSGKDAFDAWAKHVGNIGPGSPCVCGREHVCEGCVALTTLSAAAARQEAERGPTES